MAAQQMHVGSPSRGCWVLSWLQGHREDHPPVCTLSPVDVEGWDLVGAQQGWGRWCLKFVLGEEEIAAGRAELYLPSTPLASWLPQNNRG